MAKASVEVETTIAVDEDILEPCLKRLKLQGFDRVQPLEVSEEGQAAAIAWGRHQGVDTPRILVWAVVPEQWELVNPESVQQNSWNWMPTGTSDDDYAQFGLATDGTNQLFFENLTSVPFEVDQLPKLEEINHYNRIKADPTYKWSLKMYNHLMHGFDAFHEQVYQNVKDRVSNKNDIILEVAKILFLESFRLSHKESSTLEFEDQGQTLRLDGVFTAAYVKQHKEKAVKQIQVAFDRFKLHPDYVVTDDRGNPQPIFDQQTHLLLSRWENYVYLLETIQNLGDIVDNRGNVTEKNGRTRGTLADISADVLGRVFDVFLRGNFESKGGLGVYLTPAPVKQAMLKIAFHDIMTETPQIITARDEEGKPAFRFCDPACGSYGFGVVAMGQLERALMELLGKETAEDARRNPFFIEMGEHSFVGADSAPLMVTLARVNMALLGAPKAKIFYTEDSLVSPQLEPCQYDLICTNPPFGTPKFAKNQATAKAAYEKNKEVILEKFRSDLKEREKGGGYDYEPTVSGLAMGGKPDGKGIWKPVKATSIDPAVLFIDRCLQLLKPGGRLLIVVPDGVLCNSGDRYVREYIMGKKDEATGEFHGGKAIVKAVISLPADTFKLSGTGAKTSILYLQKRHARKDDPQKFQDDPQPDVFMAVADQLGYVVKNNVETYDPKVVDDLVPIFGAYRRGE